MLRMPTYRALSGLLRFLLCLMLLGGALSTPLQGQAHLTNAGFEGEAQDATVPLGWFPCQEGTTPDILPGFWGVYHEAAEGDTFLGLITREDGTWESIGQRFSQPLQANECYGFSLQLAHSPAYAGYSEPVILRIWGGENRCGKTQLLLETEPIEEEEWRTHTLAFATKSKLHYILIEAFFPQTGQAVRGNVLIDALSPVERCIRASLF